MTDLCAGGDLASTNRPNGFVGNHDLTIMMEGEAPESG